MGCLRLPCGPRSRVPGSLGETAAAAGDSARSLRPGNKPGPGQPGLPVARTGPPQSQRGPSPPASVRLGAGDAATGKSGMRPGRPQHQGKATRRGIRSGGSAGSLLGSALAAVTVSSQSSPIQISSMNHDDRDAR